MGDVEIQSVLHLKICINYRIRNNYLIDQSGGAPVLLTTWLNTQTFR